MKTGQYYFDTLSETERKQFMANFDKHIQRDNYMESKFSGMVEFISAAFTWKSTPEGIDYWNEIANRKID